MLTPTTVITMTLTYTHINTYTLAHRSDSLALKSNRNGDCVSDHPDVYIYNMLRVTYTSIIYHLFRYIISRFYHLSPPYNTLFQARPMPLHNRTQENRLCKRQPIHRSGTWGKKNYSHTQKSENTYPKPSNPCHLGAPN